MWKDILDFGRQLISLTKQTQQHATDLKDLQQELKDVRQELRALSQAVQQLHFEQQRDRDMAARDRENLILRLENYLLRHERGLPPGNSENGPGEPQKDSKSARLRYTCWASTTSA